MLKAYADEHVVVPLVEALRKRGMDIVTVQEQGREGTNDAKLLVEALREQRVMLTSDQDFLALASQCTTRGETFAPIFFWSQQRRTIGQLVRSIIREASQNDYAKACSHVFFL